MAYIRMPQKVAYPSMWESSPRMDWSSRLIRPDATDRLKSAVNSIARRASADLLPASAVSVRPSSIRLALSVSAISAVVLDIRVSVSDMRKALPNLNSRACFNWQSVGITRAESAVCLCVGGVWAKYARGTARRTILPRLDCPVK